VARQYPRAAQRDRARDAPGRPRSPRASGLHNAHATVNPTQFKLPPEGVNLEEVERQLLVQALDRSGGNQTHAAQLLGINRDQVRYRVEKFGLSKA
jgi:transcriptional regulator with GAF, ATPase, and Fis domain